jgi:tetratricopeptide (TPR) repeat protein
MTGEVDFEIMDRREVDRVLDDLRGSSGRDQRAMEVLNEWQSVEVHLTGEVHTHNVREKLSENEFVDKEGAKHKKYSLQAVASVTAVIEASNSSSDRAFDNVKLAEVTSEVSTAVDTMPRPIDHAGLLEVARRNIVERYLLRVTPREEYVQVKLFKDGDFPELGAGNGLARTGTWDGALDRYRTALERMTGELAAKRYKALFNIGVALEYSNQFDEARKTLQEAYALEQDDVILREIENVSLREEEYAELLEQA